MLTFIEKVVPLYRISRYGEDFFKVSKRLFNPPPQRLVARCDFKSYDHKLDNAFCRARSIIREYALCNEWEYFFTFTLNGARWSRYCLSDVIGCLLQWLQNQRRVNPKLKYLLVPEQHEDGAWHFHGLISGIVTSPLPRWAPKRIRDDGYLDWVDYRMKFGWCSLSPVRSAVGVGFYICKYITKASYDLASMKGIHMYYHSRGLSRSLPVGYLYHHDSALDVYCTRGSDFYAFGYFHDHVDNVVALCDEVVGEDNVIASFPVLSPDVVSFLSGDQMSMAEWCSGNIPVSSSGAVGSIPTSASSE